MKIRRWYAASAASNAGHRWRNTRILSSPFRPSKTASRKPVFLSRSTRDALDRIVRMFGERRMSVSGLVENIARQHLATYSEDIEAWRKL